VTRKKMSNTFKDLA